jgi:hypothetical protein
MGVHDPAAASAARSSHAARRQRTARVGLLGGGTDGNEQLTAITGSLLIVLLLVIGVTILRIRQLIGVHLFVGLVLLGPVALKMASTGYRFARYYLHNRAYHDKGPPDAPLRAIAPIVVLTTIVVFVSGLLLLFGGASSRDKYLELHKVSFIVWVVFTALHILGHLPQLPRSLRAVPRGADGLSPGARGRWMAVAGALVGGVVLALLLIPDFASWTAANAIPHHHHHHD